MKNIKGMDSNIQCPNCWGYQEYEGEVISTVIKPINPKGWIVKYISSFLTAS